MKEMQPYSSIASYRSKDGYDFDFASDRWVTSRSGELVFKNFNEIINFDLLQSFKSVMIYYAINLSFSHCYSIVGRFLHFCRHAHAHAGPLASISGTDLANYKASLDTRNEWYVGTIAGLFKKWTELGYPGLNQDLLATINNWRLKGNIKGEAVQLQSATDGAYTDLEYEAIYNYIIKSLGEGRITIEESSLIILLGFSGRRPLQLADLQIQDFACVNSKEGFIDYALNVPRRKQRDLSFRGEFRPFALNSENGLIISKHVGDLKKIKGPVSDFLGARFPIFPDWDKISLHAFSSLNDLYRLPGDYFRNRPIATAACSA